MRCITAAKLQKTMQQFYIVSVFSTIYANKLNQLKTIDQQANFTTNRRVNSNVILITVK